MEDLESLLRHLAQLHLPMKSHLPPAWATAVSGDQFVAVDGEVFAEWARCNALDLSKYSRLRIHN